MSFENPAAHAPHFVIRRYSSRYLLLWTTLALGGCGGEASPGAPTATSSVAGTSTSGGTNTTEAASVTSGGSAQGSLTSATSASETSSTGASTTSAQSTGAQPTSGSTGALDTTGVGGTTSTTENAVSTATGSVSTNNNVTTTGSTTGGDPGDPTPWLHVEGNKIKNPAGSDVILRGVSLIDIGSQEEWDGGVIEMVDRLTNQSDTQGSSAGWHPKVLRLPVYPADSEDHESPFTYQPGSSTFYDELLRPLVDYIGSKGMYAIIDWHYIDDTNLHTATTNAFWQDIAPRFAGDSHVLFELYNEPINLESGWPTVRSNMQTWYDTVRALAPNNLILVGTPNWCQLVGTAAADPLDANNVAYVAHMYPMHWAEPSLREQITDAASSVPVFVSEWGFEQGSDEVVDGNQTSYGDPFKAFIEEHGLSWTAWVAHHSWFPSMFDENWNLLVGSGYMGGFAKDWLYERRLDHLP